MNELNTLNWADLATSDAAAATQFYCDVFGWETNPIPMGDGLDYVMLLNAGRQVAALFQSSAEMLQQMPPHWKCYVRVENADAAAARAKELGGNVLMEAFDVMEDVGRMAMVQDPSGGVLAVWQAIKHQGADVMMEPGSLCWMELLTRDTDAAAAFYKGLFGWTAQKSEAAAAMNYTEFHAGGRGVGGMLPMPEEAGAMPPCWTPYFAVADLQDTLNKATARGANICMPPKEIPKVGTIAWFVDPQGATIALIQPDMAHMAM